MPTVKKTCPICAEKVAQKEDEVTVCNKCGHPFRPSDK